ncbi:MAG: glycosyltransferase family 4 protein [Candidatus Woykebacteria bacterium]
MKILIISQYFYPESGAGSSRAYFFAKYLTELGHSIKVLCATPNYPSGEVYKGYKNSWRNKENLSGINVIRTLVYPARYSGFAKRFFNYASFTFSSSAELLRGEDFDVILVSSPPISVFLVGLLARNVKKTPLVLDVRDVWPGAAVATGNLKTKWVVKALETLEKLSYKKANKIVTVNEETKGILLENNDFLEKENVEVVFNGVDLELFKQIPKHSIKTKNTVTLSIVYTGTIGEQHSFSTFLETLSMLNKKAKNVKFSVIGEGSKRDYFIEAIDEKKLSNISFRRDLKYRDIPSLLNNYDLGLALLRSNKYLDSAYPVKTFDYMAAGKPVLVSGGLAMRKLVEENKIGFWVPAEDPKALASKVIEISRLPRNKLWEMGERGRKLVEERFNRAEQAKKLEKILEDVVQSENRS